MLAECGAEFCAKAALKMGVVTAVACGQTSWEGNREGKEGSSGFVIVFVLDIVFDIVFVIVCVMACVIKYCAHSEYIVVR